MNSDTAKKCDIMCSAVLWLLVPDAKPVFFPPPVTDENSESESDTEEKLKGRTSK